MQDQTQDIGFNSDAEINNHRSSCASLVIASEKFHQKQKFDNSIHSDPMSNLEHFNCSFWSYQHLVQNNNSGITAMIIIAILDSYHDIGRKASRFLLPALKVLIEKSEKKQEEVFKENQMKIPKDPISVYQWLRLDPTLVSYVSCPEFWFLASQCEVEGNLNIKCHRYLEPHQI
ncbi:hypothetical protein O181_115792 [Austropuccinia psidii MF-1]|uniref:Uncharacterized protein n=1 Tax=Austropuccinia psidii MF-1 TaxID=1389203 RepID=A0A9Q3KA67_9BASI|nr:hypothetical protein [Austropuccinia psidii MF-1]